MSDFKPPRYVAYPRSSDYALYGFYGFYGSSKRLAALRDAWNYGRGPYMAVNFSWMLLTPHSGGPSLKQALDLSFVGFFAFFAIIPSVIFYCRCIKLADALGSGRGWWAFASIILAVNPIYWNLFAPHAVRIIGYIFVAIGVTSVLEFLIASEAKKYGIKFKHKDTAPFDQAMKDRQAMEDNLPPVPADLYLGISPSH